MAVKFYHRVPGGQRDRMEVELGAIRFMRQNGISNVPELLAYDKERAVSIFEFVPGRPVDSAALSYEDIRQAAGFLSALAGLTDKPGASQLPRAAEAFFSLEDVAANINERWQRLASVEENDIVTKEMHHFLEHRFSPLFEKVKNFSQKRMQGAGCGWRNILPRHLRTLSPSDFGFHNALLGEDGIWVFFDFEYFGWDDPAKMLADFFLHPAMELTSELKRAFWDALTESWGEKEELVRRFHAAYPLFGLKWCLILLNEFVKEDLDRRRFASVQGHETRELRRRQLAKAETMLNKVADTYEQRYGFI